MPKYFSGNYELLSCNFKQVLGPCIPYSKNLWTYHCEELDMYSCILLLCLTYKKKCSINKFTSHKVSMVTFQIHAVCVHTCISVQAAEKKL